MDIKKYIESGALELYVLGRLSDQDAMEVSRYASEHPDVAAEIGRIEATLEQLAFTVAEDVNPDVLDRTLEQIRRQNNSSSYPGKDGPQPPNNGNSTNWLAWLIALAAIAAAAWFWSANRASQTELQNTQEELQQLQNDCQTIGKDRDASRDILASLTKPETRNIVLQGTDNAPKKQAVVFYNTEDEATLFSASNLPAPPAGKQYQLWAIDGEGPKSLGILDLNLQSGAILSVDFLPGVAAFAITLEDLGGQNTPDLSQLQVIGEV